jgi:hypothetical protein
MIILVTDKRMCRGADACISLDAKPNCFLEQQWAVYEQDGSALVRSSGSDGHTYEDRNGSWFQVE